MKVRVRSFATFRHILGKELDLDLNGEAGIEDLVNVLCSVHGELRALLFDGSQLKPDVNILVNGQNIEGLEGIRTKLAEGDEVALFPAAIGG